MTNHPFYGDGTFRNRRVCPLPLRSKNGEGPFHDTFWERARATFFGECKCGNFGQFWLHKCFFFRIVRARVQSNETLLRLYTLVLIEKMKTEKNRLKISRKFLPEKDNTSSFCQTPNERWPEPQWWYGSYGLTKRLAETKFRTRVCGVTESRGGTGAWNRSHVVSAYGWKEFHDDSW